MNICAPQKYDKENNTCFTIEQLMEMASAYNRYLAKQKLQNAMTTDIPFINIKPDKKYLLRELKKRFDKICGINEICLTKQSFMNEIVKEMREELENDTFRPEGPKAAHEWLSTFDINNFMKQYQKIYPDFIFFGAVPLNCEQLSFCSLFKIDFDKYRKQKINYLGIIFNLDRYGEPGSHWVTVFIDMKNGEINFCDSTGKPPREDILTFINKFLDYYQNIDGKKAIYKYNKIAYQMDNSECGIYASNFIIRRLAGESFDSIVNNYLSFKDINSCRNAYFRNAISDQRPHPKCDP